MNLTPFNVFWKLWEIFEKLIVLVLLFLSIANIAITFVMWQKQKKLANYECDV